MGVSKVVSIEFPILMTKLTFMPQISIVLNSKTLSNKGPIRNMFIIRSCRENEALKKSLALLKSASTKNMDRRICVIETPLNTSLHELQCASKTTLHIINACSYSLLH
jgi:hypothetical protein